jgi:hypothetical protein
MTETNDQWLSQYTTSLENYEILTGDHELRLEMMNGVLMTKAGAPIILVGDVAPYPQHVQPFVLIAGLRQEEIERVVAVVKQIQSEQAH